MARLADIDKLLEKQFFSLDDDGYGMMVVSVTDIISAPTVERKKGRWEPRTDVIGFVRCSVCHDCNIYDDWADGKKWSFCPNCGADMKGDEDG